MAPSTSKAASAKDRRKSDKVDRTDKSPEKTSSPPFVVTLRIAPEKLRAILDPSSIVQEESPANDSPATSNTLPAAPAENASDSTPTTPAASGTPAPQMPMGPPADGPKKKGVKRNAAAMNGNGEPKVRGKPGPKKKARL